MCNFALREYPWDTQCLPVVGSIHREPCYHPLAMNLFIIKEGLCILMAYIRAVGMRMASFIASE